MKIIGLTGSSGSGKDTVSEILEKKYKAKIVNADEVAKKLQKKGSLYFKSIVSYFGSEIIYENGELNRKKLADIIYEDEEKREELNKLTFIYVVDEIKKQINKMGGKILVINAPLLFESNLNQICDFVIGIIADEEEKIDRIINRDKITKKEAKKRLRAQKSDEFIEENVDYILYNKNGIRDLEKQITKINILK